MVSKGQPFDVGGLHITGLNATFDDQQQPGVVESLDPISGKPHGVWLIIRMHVTNNGNRAHSLNGMFQSLYINDRKYSPTRS